MLLPPRSMTWVYGLLFSLLFLMLLCASLGVVFTNGWLPLLLWAGVFFLIGVLIFWHYQNTQRLTKERAAFQQQQWQVRQLQAQQYAYQQWQAYQQALRQQHVEARRHYEEEQKRLRYINNVGGLLTMSGTEFEQAIATLLKAYGYRHVQHTGKSGDQGADLTAISPHGESIIVQCKRYAPGQNVGAPAIRDFLGSIQIHQADRGVFVTTSRLTQPAQELANNHAIEVLDGDRLNAMLAQIRRP